MADYRYMILGGGIAAGYAAREFVKQGIAAGEVCIISADNSLPYDRPSLSKSYLIGKKEKNDILINSPEFYKNNGIQVLLETVVGRVDTDQKLLYSENGTFGYEKLLIATGARVRKFRTPGADLAGIHYLRRLSNSQTIREAAVQGKQAVVIGGSFIGMEVAASLRMRGLEVTQVFMEPRIWEPQFTPEMSEFFEGYFRDKGVNFVPGELVAAFEGESGHVNAVVLESGKRLPAELVVAGIGVIPNTEIFANTPLIINNGILVNQYLETNVPDVFAAGDVARYHDVIFNSEQRFEHWDNAAAQGSHTARGMLGQRETFKHVPYFFSDIFDLSYEYWGNNTGAEAVVYRGDVNDGKFSTWWLKGGRLIAAFVMNRPDEERDLAEQLIMSKDQVSKGFLADEQHPIRKEIAGN
jgi:3-phenylpropionate/trans-cinnamate dioxygenase ferredoxin reductase subunit